MFEYQPKKPRDAALKQLLPEDLFECAQHYNMLGIGCWAIFFSELGWWSSKLDEIKAKVNQEFSTYSSLVNDCCNFMIGRLRQCEKQEHPRVFLEAILSFLGQEGFEYRDDASFLDLFQLSSHHKRERYLSCHTISLFALDVYLKVVETLSSTPHYDEDRSSFFNAHADCGVVISLKHQFNFFGRYLLDTLAWTVEERSEPINQLAPITAIPSNQVYFMAYDELASFTIGRLKNYEKALEIAKEACGLYPSNPVLYLKKGFILQNLKKPQEAIDYLMKGYQLLLSEEPLRYDVANLQGAFEYEIANSYFELGDFEQALAWVDRASSRESVNLKRKALPLKVEILYGLGRFEEATDLGNSLKFLGLTKPSRDTGLIII